MQSRWLNRLTAIPLFLALTACPATNNEVASASNNTSNAPVGAAISTLPDDADPALWVLKDEDTTIYLFGTIHILKPGMSWFDEAVKEAFDKSDELVVEMVEPDPAEMVKIVNDLAIDKTGTSLRNKLNEEDRKKYETALEKLNVPTGSFDPLEPWFASVTISIIPLINNGYDVNQGVEGELNSQAKAREMTVTGLETPRQQLGFFDNLPEETQIRFLNFTIESLGQTIEGMNTMVNHWARANVDALGESMNAGLEDKLLYDTLLSNRNENWSVWIKERMKKSGTVFMAVGAGHLAGESSLQKKLKDKGIIVSRIEY